MHFIYKYINHANQVALSNVIVRQFGQYCQKRTESAMFFLAEGHLSCALCVKSGIFSEWPTASRRAERPRSPDELAGNVANFYSLLMPSKFNPSTIPKPSQKKLPTAIKNERKMMFDVLHSVVDLIGGMVSPNVEVVLHDLTEPEKSVVAIANGHISKRGVGYSVLSGPAITAGFDDVVQVSTARGLPKHTVVKNYTTVSNEGRNQRSSAAIFRDSEGAPFAALSLNADLTVIEMTHTWLGRMLHGEQEMSVPVNAPPEMDTLAHEIINEAIAFLGKPLSLMNKEEKVHAVNTMMERGLFIVKGGVDKAAAALGVTRFTVYNYLEELRQRHGDTKNAPVRKQKPRTGSTGQKKNTTA